MKSIDELKADVDAAKAALAAAQSALDEACVAAHRFKIGDAVVNKRGQQGDVIRFSRVYSGAAAVIQLRRKDGSPGVRERLEYSWDEWRLA